MGSLGRSDYNIRETRILNLNKINSKGMQRELVTVMVWEHLLQGMTINKQWLILHELTEFTSNIYPAKAEESLPQEKQSSHAIKSYFRPKEKPYNISKNSQRVGTISDLNKGGKRHE